MNASPTLSSPPDVVDSLASIDGRDDGVDDPAMASARDAGLTADAPTAELRGRLRSMQLDAVLPWMPCIAVAHLAAAALLGVVFRPLGNEAVAAGWLGLLVLLLGFGLREWHRARRLPRNRQSSRRDVYRITLIFVSLAWLWAVPAPVVAIGATAPQILTVTAVVAALIGLSGFALATLRVAGTWFPLVCGVGGVIAVLASTAPLSWPLAALLAGHAVSTAIGTRRAARSFKGRVVAEIRTEQQRQVIGLLLGDFEQHAADVLWEIDAEGRLQRVSSRLARMFGRSARTLDGRDLFDLLTRRQRQLPDNLQADAESAIHQFRQHFAARRPFRDVEIPVMLKQRVLWWSFTAKPSGDTGMWRGVAANVTAMREAQRHVWQLAHYDGITGLSNRHHFRLELESALESVRCDGGLCAVLCLDLDGFKTVNDGLGHDVGDKLLRVIGQRLEAVRRKGDLVARLGGDEFGIIVRDIADGNEAGLVAGRVLYALSRPCELDGVTVPVGASLGIALAPDHGVQCDLLLKHADMALYAAKGAGRGQYQFYTDDMGEKVMKRLTIERALAGAISGRQLHLVYQPQLDLATGRIAGCEALLRWRHPELGDVGPMDFIPVAEDAGMIAEIGRWVLHEACNAARAWPDQLRVSVNLSPLQVMARDIRADVAQALAESGLPARRLEIEITESVLLGDSPSTLEKLHALRDLGVRIALDDFGTGYSSLAYLRKFPFDQLKIDQAFVREIVERPDARAIVRATIDMARALRMDTIAEGVEDETTLMLLLEQKCDAVQGYLVGTPMPADEMTKFLADWNSSDAPETSQRHTGSDSARMQVHRQP